MRSDAEYKSLQKQLDATKEQLNTVQLNFKDEQAKAKELLEKERKATVRPIFERFIMSKLCLHSSNMS
jgi:predicted ATP-dependent endonuclease of OLD family